ncbi:MAG: hypothetical protein HQM12_18575 [SAR324 cluster bacterium]|nr:hypothetical protein [SAR324 cluster bacterium]
MISEQDRNAIIQTARNYGAHRILLFGSSSFPSGEGKDIDIAVEGIPPKKFFQFYGELMFKVSKPLDIVDLSQNSRFTQLVRQDGMVLYERFENPY